MRTWVLNPDAEMELRHMQRGKRGPYAASQSLTREMEQRRESFAPLVGADDALFVHELGKAPRDAVALPWCPTPSALAALERGGWRVPPHASSQLLLRANNKSHLADWTNATLPGRFVSQRPDEVLHACAKGRKRLKRSFGFSGRGQRCVDQDPSADDRRWIGDSLRQVHLIVEPEVDPDDLLSIHGLIAPSGEVLGEPLRLSCDRFGSVTKTNLAHAPAALDAEMKTHGASVQESLGSAGYLGPWGIDCVAIDGALFVIDLNARFSLGWSLGMGEGRAAALRLYCATS